MMHSKKAIYTFDCFELNPNERQLLKSGQPITLAPKVYETLLLLVQNSGHVLEKNELMERIWPDSYVEETNLAQNISILRKALGEGNERKFIETVPKLGYRFTAAVNVAEGDRAFINPAKNRHPDATHRSTDQTENPRNESAIAESNQLSYFAPIRKPLETKYVQSGEANIAYQVIGNGSIDLVFVMGWVSHLDYFWQEPSFAYFLNRLASFARLILFDKRGTGLSDRVPVNQLPTLEQRMEDVHAVLDAVGSTRTVLCGVSEGGPMCSLFAATYPERTLALVMIGSYARRMQDVDYPWGPTPAQREHFFQEIITRWGEPVGIEDRAPSMMNDERFRQWWSTYLRMGASPGAALALTKMNAEIDVRPILSTIHVPTLVLHRKGDTCLKLEEGKYLAQRIPGAHFIALDGVDHLPFVGDQDAILDEIEQFLTGLHHEIESDRVLATVLHTQLCSLPSGAYGADWNVMLNHHHSYVKKAIELFRGKAHLVNEREMIATFDGPARAIRCAKAINESAIRVGIPIQTGLHTGECDLLGEEVSGVAVDVCQALTRLAAQNTVLVSSTVKDLVAGSGLTFVERGSCRLTNEGEEWRLFAVA